MGIVGALDLHRSQITYHWQDLATGEVHRGRIVPGAREPLRAWLAGFHGADAHFALEATTGWRFVVEELDRAGCTPHLGDPAEISTRRGPKRRAKTDRADCEHMTALLLEARLPECWILWGALIRFMLVSRAFGPGSETGLGLPFEAVGISGPHHAEARPPKLSGGLKLRPASPQTEPAGVGPLAIPLGDPPTPDLAADPEARSAA